MGKYALKGGRRPSAALLNSAGTGILYRRISATCFSRRDEGRFESALGIWLAGTNPRKNTFWSFADLREQIGIDAITSKATRVE